MIGTDMVRGEVPPLRLMKKGRRQRRKLHGIYELFERSYLNDLHPWGYLRWYASEKQRDEALRTQSAKPPPRPGHLSLGPDYVGAVSRWPGRR